jgi:hypothetical protein
VSATAAAPKTTATASVQFMSDTDAISRRWNHHQRCSIRNRKEATMHEGVKSGISFGSALAITISWSKWHSILWAMIHGVLSWFYVIYYALTR